MTRTIVVADIGGTNARFAIAKVAAGRVIVLGEPTTLKTADHASFQRAWQDFCARHPGDEPDGIGIAFAGPSSGEALKLTNSSWILQPALMKEQLGVKDFTIVNDFGAIAHAVVQLGERYFDHLCGPDQPIGGHRLTSVIGPGTGLGVAQLLRTGNDHHVIETEGGHMDFAPLDSLEDQILTLLRRTLGRVSVERVASGSGLTNIYQSLAEIEGRAVPDVEDKALWTAALEGADVLARSALDRFFLTLGAVAGDTALAHGAQCVVIAGGLSYRLRDRFANSGFAGRFIAKGRFQQRMEAIPVKLVTHPQPGLFGAAAAFARAHA